MLRWTSVSVLLVVAPCVSFVRGFVPAPSNISFQCRNFQNVLYWNYSEPDLQTEFVVKVHSYKSGSQSNLPTNRTYLDVSEYSKDIKDSYWLQVTTKLNGSESEPSENVYFTYDEDFDTDFKCVMDFPAVNVTVLEHKVTFSFSHPFSIYQVDYLQDIFTYSVMYNKLESSYECHLDEDLCTQVIDFHESLFEQCISLRFTGSNGIASETAKVICGQTKAASQNDWAMILTFLACAGFAIGFLILAGAAVLKNETNPGNNAAIVSKLLAFVKADRVVHEPEQPVLSEVTSIGSAPLLENTLDFPPQTINTTDEITHMPILHSPTSTEACEEQESEEEDAWEKNDNSGYDCKKFLVDMDSGDLVDAYGPR